jgi:hypothetical protein
MECLWKILWKVLVLVIGQVYPIELIAGKPKSLPWSKETQGVPLG